MQKLLLLLILSFVPAVGCAELLRVFASVEPSQTLVEKVGGQHVDARVMVELHLVLLVGGVNFLSATLAQILDRRRACLAALQGAGRGAIDA